MTDFLKIIRTGQVGVISLNRPSALNALTYDMICELKCQMELWHKDPQIALVVVKSESSRAFCAGGDIRYIAHNSSENPDTAQQFYEDEYALNALMFEYEKPIVALVDGIVMGGGVGISAPASHRILTEHVTYAMPETAIGFFPDVGASYYMSRMPGGLGMYLGLTGRHIKTPDALLSGYGSAFVPSEKLSDLFDKIVSSKYGNDAYQNLADIIESFTVHSPGDSGLRELGHIISHVFSDSSLEDIFERLGVLSNEADPKQRTWASDTLLVLNKACPFSLCVTHEAITRGYQLQFKDCLKMEYRLSGALASRSDFVEGVRAAIIDKDKSPKWSHASFKSVIQRDVLACFEYGDVLTI